MRKMQGQFAGFKEFYDQYTRRRSDLLEAYTGSGSAFQVMISLPGSLPMTRLSLARDIMLTAFDNGLDR